MMPTLIAAATMEGVLELLSDTKLWHPPQMTFTRFTNVKVSHENAGGSSLWIVQTHAYTDWSVRNDKYAEITLRVDLENSTLNLAILQVNTTFQLQQREIMTDGNELSIMLLSDKSNHENITLSSVTRLRIYG